MMVWAVCSSPFLGVIGFLTGVYSIGYMRHEVAHGELSPVTLCDYYGFFHLFLFTMLLVVTSNKPDCDVGGDRSHHLKLGVSGRHLRSAFIAGSSMEVHHYLYCWCRFWSVRYRAGIRQRRQRYAAGRNGDILERGS
ncbi:hydrogenase 4, membrane subunit HyfF [Escherichia coli]|uniref:Hydrogenase 4, membrane subunit HyfF n=1 Tax=Escherichia coli TaxID=562 RepID=A0A376KP81_ECOLX|nr:hydrogenase 4, membrane subunit HyfF [Escherichia coli]